MNNSENEIKEVQDGFKMAFNEKDGTGYASFKNTVVPSGRQVKQVQQRYSKTENLELTQHILVMPLLKILIIILYCLY